MSWVLSYAVAEWLGIGADYIFAGLAIAAGVYLSAFFDLPPANPVAWLLRPLRYGGYALVIGGVAFGYGTYRESIGASRCEAAWKQKNYELQIANLTRDLNAQKAAAKEKADEATALAKQKKESDERIADYESSVQALSATVAACRRASPDDDRRLCNIIGDSAAGCRAAN